jgi:AAA ATPase domain
MINSLRIENFKSLRKVDLELGRFNIFIGTNASGKSNVFDALRFLQGIGNGFTLSEILDGKPRSSTSEVWEPIRGGSANVAFLSDDPVRMEVLARSAEKEHKWVTRYGIGFDAKKARLTEEWLSSNGDIYDSREVQRLTTDPVFEVKYYQGKKGRQPHLRFEPSTPVLTQLAKGNQKQLSKPDIDRAVQLAKLFANMPTIGSFARCAAFVFSSTANSPDGRARRKLLRLSPYNLRGSKNQGRIFDLASRSETCRSGRCRNSLRCHW